jgi:drug/metabolite transporter (DMT)-like permease
MSRSPAGLAPRFANPKQARGILLAVGGASLISFDGLLIRLQALTPAGVIFWRGLLSGIAFAVMVALVRWRGGRSRSQHFGEWWPLSALVALMVLGTLTWVLSLTHTSVAHTLVIITSAPILTALLGRLLLREQLPARTWIAGVVVLIGVMIVFSSSLGSGKVQGDLWALVNTVVFALILITLRRYQQVNRLLALTISGFLVAAMASPWGAQLPDTRSLLAAALDGLIVVPGGLVLITLAPRYLPAAEVGLLLLMETILAPLWVLIALGEALTAQVVLSGVVIICAISVHSLLELKGGRIQTKEAVEV